MNGRIYISGSFSSIDVEKTTDNDPHFWNSPPTWGICRPDFLRNVKIGDFVFYVLPSKIKLPQMIFAYIKVKEIITHDKAYKRFPLKRMIPYSKPKGNILVDEYGNYNRLDYGYHRSNFELRKQFYVVGCQRDSRLFSFEEIISLSHNFNNTLNKIFKVRNKSKSNFEIISRGGRKLNQQQVETLLNFLKC